jgi:hypothetical protein
LFRANRSVVGELFRELKGQNSASIPLLNSAAGHMTTGSRRGERGISTGPSGDSRPTAKVGSVVAVLQFLNADLHSSMQGSELLALEPF